jgi:hypothetical protein
MLTSPSQLLQELAEKAADNARLLQQLDEARIKANGLAAEQQGLQRRVAALAADLGQVLQAKAEQAAQLQVRAVCRQHCISLHVQNIQSVAHVLHVQQVHPCAQCADGTALRLLSV